METLLYISASIALLALAGLFVYLIKFFSSTKGLLNTVTNTVQGLIGEIGAIRNSLQGTIKNVEGITGKVEGTVDRLNDSMERVNSQLDQVEGIVESVKVMTEDVSRLTTDATDVVHGAKNVVVGVIGMVDNVQSSVQKPVNELMTIFSALGNGIRKFRMKLGGAESSNGHTLELSPEERMKRLMLEEQYVNTSISGADGSASGSSMNGRSSGSTDGLSGSRAGGQDGSSTTIVTQTTIVAEEVE